jgi:hypothetical protein
MPATRRKGADCIGCRVAANPAWAGTRRQGIPLEQFTNEMNELLCKDLRGESLSRNRSKAGFARR